MYETNREMFRRHHCTYLLALLIFFLIPDGKIRAQSYAPTAVRPGSPAGSSQLSGFESINHYSGNLNFSLPLIETSGRGSGSFPIKLNINPKFVDKVGYSYLDGNLHPYIREDNWGERMWADKGYVPGKMIGIQSGSGFRDSCPGQGPPTFGTTITTLSFTAPDGTQYEFKDRNTGGQPYNVNCNLNAYPRGNIFDSVDGSGSIFISDWVVADQPFANLSENDYHFYPTGYLTTRDGTHYRIEGGYPVWSRDRNGNKTTFSYSYGQFGSLIGFKITDSLNREIIVELNVQAAAPYGVSDRISYKGFGGATRTIHISYKPLQDSLRSGYTIQTGQQLFPGNYPFCQSGDIDNCGDENYNPFRVSDIWLPDGRRYKLQYNSYGEIAKVEMPTGGAIEYDWELGSGSGRFNTWSGATIIRRIVQRRSYDDGISLSNKLVLGGLEPLGSRTGYVFEDLYDNINTLVHRTKHYYYGILGPGEYPPNPPGFDYGLFESWRNGREYQTETYANPGTTLLRRTTYDWAQLAPSWWNQAWEYAPVNNPRIYQATTLLADSNQVSKRTFSHDVFGNVTDTYEYDYGIGAPGPFLRRSHTDYLTTNPVNNVNYTSDTIHILNLPTQSWVSSDTNGNNKISLSKFEYDNYAFDSGHAPLVDRSNISGHDSNYGMSYTPRGLVTKVTSYADAQNQTGAVSAYTQYDIAGNVVKAIDAKANASTISYNDSFGSPDAEAKTNSAPTLLNGQQTYAFATSATNVVGYTGYTQFDYFTGDGVDSEDFIGNVSTTFYNDVLDRPTQTISANNRPQFRRQSSVFYDDVNRKTTITSDSKVYGDNLIKAESFYDKMGRTTEARQYEDAANYVVAQQQYDSLGRAYKSSNPFRPNLNETPQWTTTSFDALGRVIEVKTPDNAIVGRSYSGTTTTVTDQSLRKRSGTSDALGRLLKVTEDPTGLNYQTDYTYDLLGRLRKTTQVEGPTTQNRYFMYNDLGRLIRAKQVEQNPNSNLPAATDPITGNSNWSVGYSYDNNGNVVSTTDANNRTITGTYDNLNRLTFRDYSEPSMPDVTFTFDDPTITNSKGQLTAVTSNVSSTSYTAFDELGRIKSSRQTTNGTNYNFPDYSYDFSGALVAQTYPSGRVVETETDDIGRLSKITSQLPSQVERTYLSNLTYTSFGAVQYVKLGNGRWESAQFDSKRLQTKQISLGASSNDASLLKIEYDFGMTDNNGNLRQQKITVPGASNQIIQNYTYDMLNRLQSATETVSGNPTPAWKQTFLYEDRFGNRRFDAANTTTLPQNNGVYNPNIDPQTNKFLVAEGYNYDAEGNLISNPENQLFTYDAENRQTQVQNTATQTTANYFYDGTGKRVRKIAGQEETVFVYDAFGKLVAEYSTIIDDRPKATNYLTSDDLGSPRIITNQLGQVVSRHDYMPFGEEVMAGTGGRTNPQGYAGNDGVRNQFTGYERDLESGLDFAQARYFSSKHGRFTSVDPLAASANIKSPQTFNRYSYALNSPYKFTDSTGLQSQCQGPGAGNNTTTAVNCESTNTNTGAQPCPPEVKCDKEGNPIIEDTFVDVKIDWDEGVTVGIGPVELPVKVNGKNWWQHVKGFVSNLFDTGTGTPTVPTPIPIPTDTGTDPSSGGTDAPSGGSDSAGGGLGTAAAALAIAAIQKKFDAMLNGEAYNGIVYRGGSDTDTNLAPSLLKTNPDFDGLSTFTKMELAAKPGKPYQVIDTSLLPGSLKAIRIGPHVSIRPHSATELYAWMLARGKPYPLTQAVRSAIIGDGKRPK